MNDDELSVPLVEDVWFALPEKLREELLTRRRSSTGWEGYRRQEWDGRRWEPLRPVIFRERAYRGLGWLAARLLHLAVEACRRRAATLGELHRALRFPHELQLMDPDRPLVAAELTRYARPDLLVERGQPRLLEFNNSTRLGGDTVTPRLAEAYARLCPQSGLHPPPSSVTARSAALVRTLGSQVGNGRPRRMLVPACWGIDANGTRRRHGKIKKPVLADAERVGLEVVQADLVDLSINAAGRLLAAGLPIDLVMVQWGSDRIVDDGGGLAALRSADRARAVELFPRTESALISSKAVLAWLHEDCAAGLLDPADSALVRNHVPWTACLGLDGDPAVHEKLLRMATDERDRLVSKPAVGKSGNGVLFGGQTSEQDWLAAAVHAACESPVVLQQRVESDRMTMPFLDRDSGQEIVAQVPYVLGPFMIDGGAASVGVRHMGPGVRAADVVISAGRGGFQSTALIAPDPV
jgi:hypothetical protein